MYRLMLYYLLMLWVVALVFTLGGIVLVNPLALLVSTLFIIFICWVTNTVFAKIFRVPTNPESVYICALILSLILTPATTTAAIPLLFWAAVFSQGSKYLLAIGRKHLFNPVACGLLLSTLVLHQFASWWIGTLPMWPFILAGGLLLIRKIRRFDLVFSFFLVVLAITRQVIFEPTLLFFAFVMCSEPLTTPPTKRLRILYGGLIGLGTLYFTPEIALLIGNFFSYLVSPKYRLLLKLQQKLKTSANTFDFIFKSNQQLAFLPGQYLEWTLGHNQPDSRGNRRYFTIASSPTEDKMNYPAASCEVSLRASSCHTIRIGIKSSEQPSSFKQALLSMKKGDRIIASQLSGEFVLPKDPAIPLTFLAGGIGITPFRSMIKYLLDKGESRPIILIYVVNKETDIAYQKLLSQTQTKLGFQLFYRITGKEGVVDEAMIKQKVPDYQKRLFYLSGPHGMVTYFEQLLLTMGVRGNNIKTDFFPGY